MPERLGEAVLELSTDDRRFDQGLKRARTGAGDLQRRFAQVSRTALRFGRNLAIGLGAAGTGLSLLFKRAVDTADEIAKTADRIGLSTKALQELRFAADQTGVDIGQLDQALTALIRRQGEAIAGNKEFAKGFERVGLTVEDLRRLTPERLIARVADGLSRIEGQALRVAAADRIMSEAGRQVINVFDGGSASLDRFAARARALGLVIDDPVLRNAEKAKDDLSILGKVIGTNLTNALLRAAPQVQKLSEAFAKGLPRILDWSAALAQVMGLLDDQGDRVARRIIDLKEKIAQLNAELDRRPLGRPTTGPTVERLRALNDELAAEQRRLREISARERDAARALGEPGTTARGAPPTAAQGLSAEGSFEALERAEQARRRLLEEGREVTERFRGASERLADAQARLERLLKSGAITQETYTRGLLAAREEFDRTSEAAAGTSKEIEGLSQEQLRAESLARELGFTFESAFEGALIEGRGLRSVLDGIIQDVQRLVLRLLVVEPLARSISEALRGGGGGGGGFLGGLLGLGSSLLGAFGFGGGGGGRAATAGTSIPGGIGGFQHGGSFRVPGPGGVDSRLVSFLATPGERVDVLPKGRGGGGVTFFIDNTGADRAAVAGMMGELRGLITALAGPGRVEERAVSAVVQRRRRDPRLFQI